MAGVRGVRGPESFSIWPSQEGFRSGDKEMEKSRVWVWEGVYRTRKQREEAISIGHLVPSIFFFLN